LSSPASPGLSDDELRRSRKADYIAAASRQTSLRHADHHR
jgi:hypothetical protein